MDTLKEFIHEEDIPTFLGGKCKCEHLGGCMKSDKGPWNEFERVPPRWVKRKDTIRSDDGSFDWHDDLDEQNSFKTPLKSIIKSSHSVRSPQT